jgi:hypothetical protein
VETVDVFRAPGSLSDDALRMPKPERTIYTFQFAATPREEHEARRIAIFLKQALRLYGLRLITMKKEPHNEDSVRSPKG